MGVSVESAEYLRRVDDLRTCGTAVKFLSLEPLLGDLGKLDFDGIDWVIAGGESGPGARPPDLDWVRSIGDQCVGRGVAFHFKQWSGVDKKRADRTLDGREWNQFADSSGRSARSDRAAARDHARPAARDGGARWRQAHRSSTGRL